MRPLILLSSLAQGGAERVTVDLLSALSEAGRSVPVCTLTRRHDGLLAQELATLRITRHDLGARRLLDPFALLRLLRLIRQERIELIHAHGQDAAILASWARTFRSFPLVITRHVLEEPSGTRRERKRARLALKAMEGACATIAVSRAVANHLGTLVSIPPDRLQVIPNGVPIHRFDPQYLSKGRHAMRHSVGAGESDLLILFPAVLRPGKGHEVLLAAAPEILEAFPQALFVLAGDGEMESSLERVAAPLGPRIRFLGNRNDIPELMNASDLVVLPSLSEALPTVAMEAAVSGRAIVASHVGGTPEIVLNGVTGLLVPPGEPEPLTKALTTLLGNADLRQSFGAAARRTALRKFGLEIQVGHITRLWEEVLERWQEAA